MSSSLVHHATQTQRNGHKLFWGRAEEDGAPYRGQVPPLLREEEHQARTIRVRDFRFGFFDVSKSDQGEAYRQVCEACANGWFQPVFIERFRNNSTIHYMEWVEYYQEDRITRVPFLPYGVVEQPQIRLADQGSQVA